MAARWAFRSSANGARPSFSTRHALLIAPLRARSMVLVWAWAPKFFIVVPHHESFSLPDFGLCRFGGGFHDGEGRELAGMARTPGRWDQPRKERPAPLECPQQCVMANAPSRDGSRLPNRLGRPRVHGGGGRGFRGAALVGRATLLGKDRVATRRAAFAVGAQTCAEQPRFQHTRHGRRKNLRRVSRQTGNGGGRLRLRWQAGVERAAR